MEKLNFITIGRAAYFPYVNFSAKQLMKFYPNCKFFIYDWGFTPYQKNILKSYPISILIDWYDKIDWKFGYKTITKEFEGYNFPIDIKTQRQNEYIMNQKPECILDCSKRINKNLIYLDGDAFLINKIDDIFEYNFDIGVTIRIKHELEKLRKREIIGEINAGVIFFLLDSKSIQLFTKEWIREIQASKRIWQDQTSLITLINKRNEEILKEYYNEGIIRISNIDFKIKAFPCDIYNLYSIEKGYDDKKVKILHIKGYIRRNEIFDRIKGIKRHLFYSKFLKIFPKFLINRVIKFIGEKTFIYFINHDKKIDLTKKFLSNELKGKKSFNKVKKFIKN